MRPDQIEFFANFIEREVGIVYSDFNRYQLINRLEEIVRTLGLRDGNELYHKSIPTMPSEIKQLVLDVATNNETSFFRDTKFFDAIASQVIPVLVRKLEAGQTVRIWSSACSFGQEPYSIAMLFHEQCKNPQALSRLEILATDIASHALSRAEKGKFSQLEIQRGLPASLIVKYFEKDGDNYWTIRPEVRGNIRFEKRNLLDNFSTLGTFDLIFCRNVLIYQTVESKKRVIAKFAERLAPEGLLLMGAGESLIGVSEEFETVRSNDAVYYKIKARQLLKTG